MKRSFVNVTGRSIVTMSGRESLDLLQRISTNDLLPLKSGQIVQTILTNDKGRIVDVVSVLPRGSENLLLAGSNPAPSVLKNWIDKFIIMEDITVADLTHTYFDLMLFGFEPNSQSVEMQGGVDLVRERWGSEELMRVLGDAGSRDSAVRNLCENGFDLAQPGYFEMYRVAAGIPMFPSELSTTYNPLEAGLDHLLSWSKGCYVGQEVIARLNTYKKVQRTLVRLSLDKYPTTLPATIVSGSDDVGTLTSASAIIDGGGTVGLGYLKVDSLQSTDELSIRQGPEVVRVAVSGR